MSKHSAPKQTLFDDEQRHTADALRIANELHHGIKLVLRREARQFKLHDLAAIAHEAAQIAIVDVMSEMYNPAIRAETVGRPEAVAADLRVGAASRKGSTSSKWGKWAKRSQGEIAQTANRFYEHVRKNPGERIERIGKQLGVKTDDLRLPIKKLIAAESIRTEGHRRATRYFPIVASEATQS